MLSKVTAESSGFCAASLGARFRGAPLPSQSYASLNGVIAIPTNMVFWGLCRDER